MAGNPLFGINIADVIAKATKGQLLKATLHITSQGARGADITAGRTESDDASHECDGIVQDYSDNRIDGTLIKVGDREILLIANSINGGNTVPKLGDGVTIEGQRYNIQPPLRRDPAAAAYVMNARPETAP